MPRKKAVTKTAELPSTTTILKEQREQNRDRQEAARLAMVEARRRMMASVVSGDAGVNFMKLLMNYCGVFQPTCSVSPQDRNVNAEGTIYNSGKRDVYLFIRQYLPENILAKIENPIRAGEEEK